MDFFDVVSSYSLGGSIQELRAEFDKLQRDHAAQSWDIPTLVAENHDLKLRLSLLIRLLISKGVFSAEEYSMMIQQAQPVSVDSTVSVPANDDPMT